MMWHRLTKTLLLLSGLGLISCTAETPEERLARLHLPPLGFQGNPVNGRQLFNNNCAQCHGFGARGSVKGPPLIDDVYRPGHHSDFAVYSAVKNGVGQHHWGFGDMSPVPGVSPKETAHIVAYIRAQQRKAGIR